MWILHGKKWILTWVLVHVSKHYTGWYIKVFSRRLKPKGEIKQLFLLTRGQLLHGPQADVTQSLGQARKQTWALDGISSWSHKSTSTPLVSPLVPFFTHLAEQQNTSVQLVSGAHFTHEIWLLLHLLGGFCSVCLRGQLSFYINNILFLSVHLLWSE